MVSRRHVFRNPHGPDAIRELGWRTVQLERRSRKVLVANSTCFSFLSSTSLLISITLSCFQLRGKWVGKWEFSKGMEKLLQRMIAPNADLRCTAMQAIADSYWKDSLATNSSHSAFFSLFFNFYLECDLLMYLFFLLFLCWVLLDQNAHLATTPPSSSRKILTSCLISRLRRGGTKRTRTIIILSISNHHQGSTLQWTYSETTRPIPPPSIRSPNQSPSPRLRLVPVRRVCLLLLDVSFLTQ